MNNWRQSTSALVGISLAIIATSAAGILIPSIAAMLALVPRDLTGITGVFTMPLVHVSWSHLAVNLGPFWILSALILLRGVNHYLLSSVSILLISGCVLWLFGHEGYHIGASGLVFGYFGYLLARGYYERKLDSVLIAVGVAVAYSGLLWGIVPTQSGVSWDGHLAGLVGGVVSARILKSNTPVH